MRVSMPTRCSPLRIGSRQRWHLLRPVVASESSGGSFWLRFDILVDMTAIRGCLSPARRVAASRAKAGTRLPRVSGPTAVHMQHAHAMLHDMRTYAPC